MRRYIVPAGKWTATDGSIVNAHAGCITTDSKTGRFYLFGEYKVEGVVEGGGVRVYSSDDLATWTDHGFALAPVEGHEYISTDHIIQRPKVVYSDTTGKYHMWWHADNSDYTWLLQGFAQSDTIQGPYQFVSATAPLGNWSQDLGLFTDIDSDGRSYALYSDGDRMEARNVYITRFNKSITALEQVVYIFRQCDLEAPTIVKTESGYYAFMSHKTGYRPNNIVAFRADRLEGPWSQPWIVNQLNTRGYNSQSGNTLNIKGTKTTTVLYLGDRWDNRSNWEATNIWLPIKFDHQSLSARIDWYDVFSLDVETGEWNEVKGKTYYNKDAKASGDAYHQEANFASHGAILTGIHGDDSTVTFLVEGAGAEQWVSFYYQNTDDMGFGDSAGGSPDRVGGSWQLRRIAWVTVNGNPDSRQTLNQKVTHKGIIMSSPLKLKLSEGRNSITIGGCWNGVSHKGADLDRIIVYPPEGC